ncbi:hypothetical protein AB0J35_59805 [Nonomuraea angiospora]|uniref:hypothetical protein n=1 Tax=Nonomuraea angiospora TaxID=46172 RepID=UPI003423BE83
MIGRGPGPPASAESSRHLLAGVGLPVTDLRVRDLGDCVRVELDACTTLLVNSRGVGWFVI